MDTPPKTGENTRSKATCKKLLADKISPFTTTLIGVEQKKTKKNTKYKTNK